MNKKLVETIKIAIVGIGNCASSLFQGVEYYRHREEGDAVGLMHWDEAYNEIEKFILEYQNDTPM